MAINYASKYASQIDERFSLEAFSTPAVNQDFDFVGTKTVKVYSLPTAAMNDYTRNGSNRYGTPAELENSEQELTLSKDRAFTYTIDRGNYNDTQMSNSAGASLQRQIREVIVPELDIYRFDKICAGAGTIDTTKTATGKLTTENVYEMFLTGQERLMDLKAPAAGRIAYVSSAFYKLIKLNDSFIKASDTAQKMILKGQVGTVDGVPIIPLPSSYMPAGVDFFITNKIACTAPVKLAEYKIHDNPPGINGWLVEGRLYYDAFVLENKKNAIYVHKTAKTT